jgi:hypothetical protein
LIGSPSKTTVVTTWDFYSFPVDTVLLCYKRLICDILNRLRSMLVRGKNQKHFIIFLFLLCIWFFVSLFVLLNFHDISMQWKIYNIAHEWCFVHLPNAFYKSIFITTRKSVSTVSINCAVNLNFITYNFTAKETKRKHFHVILIICMTCSHQWF